MSPDLRKAESYIACLEAEGCLVNLAGDYSYMSAGYYASQDLETEGENVHPTCKEGIDAYVVPLFMEKAKLAGLPIPTYYITNDYFEPPVVVDTINPFMDRYSVVLKEGRRDAVTASLTRNYTYAVCCQELPPGARVSRFNAVLGWSVSPRYRELAKAVWDVFRMPLAEVRVIAPKGGEPLLSALKPLPYKNLNQREARHIDRVVTWQI